MNRTFDIYFLMPHILKRRARLWAYAVHTGSTLVGVNFRKMLNADSQHVSYSDIRSKAAYNYES